MPEIIHEEQGLRIRRNDTNRFTVVTLHFMADPSKREAWWAEEAARGMPQAQFDREYNIKYITASGEKVFPEILAHRDRIVVESPYPEVPKAQICYGGFDFGLRNQTSFHVYTVMQPPEGGDPRIYAIWELYETTSSLQELSDRMQECPYWGQIKWIAADRHLASRDQIDLGGVNSKWDQLCAVGVGKKMVMAPSNESDWITLMRDYWYQLDSENSTPKFQIYSNCVNMIKEFEEAVFDDMSDVVQRKHNLKEKIRDKNNHAMDDCKYFMLLGPRLRGELQRKTTREGEKKELWRRHLN